MKKKEVLDAVTSARNAGRFANARLRDTAHVFDESLVRHGESHLSVASSAIRPATEQERKEAIIDGWIWAHEMAVRASKAATVALRYAKQNGITIEEIDRRYRERSKS